MISIYYASNEPVDLSTSVRQKKRKKMETMTGTGGGETQMCVCLFLFCSRLQFMLWTENWSWIFTYFCASILFISTFHKLNLPTWKTWILTKEKCVFKMKIKWMYISPICTVNRGRCLYVIHARMFILRGWQKLCFSHLKSW